MDYTDLIDELNSMNSDDIANMDLDNCIEIISHFSGNPLLFINLLR